MNFRVLKILLYAFLLFYGSNSFATHNRAGEISFEQIGSLTLRVTVTTYTKTSSIAADRDSIEIFWGDGTSQFVLRDNGWGDPQPNDIKINYYTAIHVYPARATYTISMYDPNRVGGILNVNYPDSESVPFYLETTFTFLNTQFQGENNSAVLLQAPIDFGCVNQVFTHNPNAYDIDGDSLWYSLIIPLQGENSFVPDYNFPNEIASGSNNVISIDHETGNLTWNSPQIAGEYNIAILIEEFRQGTLINSMIRDMQIFIEDNCENSPPTLELDDEICVFAGDTVKIKISVNDPDQGQKVRLEASGAPFISTQNMAELQGGNEFTDIEFEAYFSWITSCEDISDQYYQIVFKAMDNGFSDTSGLATLMTYKVKVIGPPPDTMTIENKLDHYQLEWAYPYVCSFAENDYFLGFSIWRSDQSQNINMDSCSFGLEGKGYEKISFLHKLNNGIIYYYQDFEVEKGGNYCYRVMPEFARKSFDGFPYNHVSGQPGNEQCITIPLNLPYLTKTSVNSTDVNDGSIELEWKMADRENFDTIVFPPPYQIEILSSINGVDYNPAADPIIYDHFTQNLDDTYNDVGLNTRNLQHHYLLDFYFGPDKELLGTSPGSSSIFLDLEADDKQLRLNFSASVPWNNHLYTIYKKGPLDSQFFQVSNTVFNNWLDESVENGNNYCYYIKSLGTYPFAPIDTLINYSQETCAVPNDITPPCPPVLTVSNECDSVDITITEEQLFNELIWSFDEQSCFEVEDLSYYQIYYAPDTGNVFTEIASIDKDESPIFKHKGEFGLNACYYVTAVDQNGNESASSNIACSSNCPIYELPNVFTPNNDGVHDLLTPRFKRHVYQIDLKIFNQWGQLVFKTTDPDINWDGTNLSGKNLAEGVYHYICKIPDLPLENSTRSLTELSGFIHLIRGN